MIRTHKPEKPFPHYNRKQTRTDIMFLLINSQLLPISLPSTVATSGHYPPKPQHLPTYTYYTVLGTSGSLLGLCLHLGSSLSHTVSFPLHPYLIKSVCQD